MTTRLREKELMRWLHLSSNLDFSLLPSQFPLPLLKSVKKILGIIITDRFYGPSQEFLSFSAYNQ